MVGPTRAGEEESALVAGLDMPVMRIFMSAMRLTSAQHKSTSLWPSICTTATSFCLLQRRHLPASSTLFTVITVLPSNLIELCVRAKSWNASVAFDSYATTA